MHKFISVRVASAVMIFIITALGLSLAGAGSIGSPWVSSALSLQQQADTTPPPSLYPNLDCADDEAGTCALPTIYGTATTNSTVSLNNEGFSLGGKGDYLPVFTYLENRQRFSRFLTLVR